MYDVITIGGATRDVFVKSAQFETREHGDSPTGLEQCMPLGTKIELDELTFETGGGATNAAVTFGRLGHRTGCLVSVGDDHSGDKVKEALRKGGCSTSLVQTMKGATTGYSIIVLAGSGERTVLVYRGASMSIDPAAVPWTRLRPKWFYVSSLGGDLRLLKRTLAHAKASGCKVAWNPGGKEIAAGLDAISPLVRMADVFNLNLEEAYALTGARDLSEALHKLSTLPKRTVVITDGDNGAYASGKEGTFKSGTIPVKRVNVTGAGDAFGSGFVAGLMHKDDLKEALAVGSWNATGVVQRMGAKLGILKKYPSAAMLRRIPISAIA